MTGFVTCPVCGGTGFAHKPVLIRGRTYVGIRAAVTRHNQGSRRCQLCFGIGGVSAFTRTAFFLWFPYGELWILSNQLDKFVEELQA